MRILWSIVLLTGLALLGFAVKLHFVMGPIISIFFVYPVAMLGTLVSVRGAYGLISRR